MCKPSSRTADEIILLTSNGGSADYYGSSMGFYQRMEKPFNNAPAYKQLHNVTVIGSQGEYIYRADEGMWVIGKELGKPGNPTRGFRNIRSTKTLPTSGWEFINMEIEIGSKWIKDIELNIEVITNISSLICPLIFNNYSIRRSSKNMA